MPNINIKVTNKRAIVEGSPVIVCGNSDYTVTFTFDDEWNLTGVRTARFVYIKDGVVQHEDRVFEGNTVEVPVLSNVTFVKVGVFAGELCTTTPARILCDPSILCGSGEVHEPTPDVYDQIMALVNELAEQGAFGATEEQARQIEQNRQDILTALAIAKGKNQARVFATTADMEFWLSDEENKGLANVGDNLYIVDVGVPDWWIAEKLEEPNEDGRYYEIAQLETQKVDLTTIEADILAINNKLFKQAFASVSILDTVKTLASGLYYFYSNCTDRPGGNGVSVILDRENASLINVIAIEAATGDIFTNSYGSAWSGWKRKANASDLANYLPLTGGEVNGIVTMLKQLRIAGGVSPTSDGSQLLGSGNFAWMNVCSWIHSLYRNGQNYGGMDISAEGTTDTQGYSRLVLGNNIPAGTAGNAKGFMWMYGSGTGSVQVHPHGATPDGSVVQVFLPKASGSLIRKENFYIDDDGYLVIDLDS